MNRRNYSRGRRPGQSGPYRTSTALNIERDREIARNRQAGGGLQWKKMDLHIHTPASSDYRDPGISYLDILKKAEEKGLDMIAFTDHNTIEGYAAMHREIETLTLLDRLGRLTDEERTRLDEYRRLLNKIVILPGFEFTATFGFHVLGIFPENTSVRKLEHLLLNLNVPEDRMVLGAPDVGSTDDVLTAYATITAAGGLAIAAHANSSNGVAMQGFPFGGQTKIAYTQDPNLVALEVTDLESPGRRNTASFYNGSKTEYPRRMHCIQGSDAHSLDTEQSDTFNKRLGVGARITEILVKDASFASLKEVLTGDDFTRTRPHRANWLWDLVEAARQEGPGPNQSFHERAVTKTSRTRPILHDVLAFANTAGGIIYVGANPDTKVPLHGLEQPEEQERILEEDIRGNIDPPIEVGMHIRHNGDKGIIVITVPKGPNRPYVFAPTGQIYMRYGAETSLASRDDIVRLVLEASREGGLEVVEPQERPVTAALGEPMASTPPVTRAAPAPAPQQARTRRERDGRVAPPPAAQHPEGTRQPQPQQPTRAQQPPVAQQEQRAPAQAQPPRPPTTGPRIAPSPALLNLPPEKIKGQVQPMFVPPQPQEDTAQIVESEMPPAEAFAPEQPELGQPQEPEAPVAEAAEMVGVAPEEVLVEEAAPRKRTRSRRKAAEEAAPEPEMVTPTAEPMEATVAAEHKTRKEIVEAVLADAVQAEEKPKRGRRKKADKELQIEAPTAAAAATEAGAEAILVEAEIEPGPQIPAELPAEAAKPKKTRSRRKKAEEPAEVVEAAEAATPEPAAEAQGPEGTPPEQAAEEAPAKGKRKPRTSKKKQAEEQAAATIPEPPDPPKTGVEVVSTEERNGVLYHTMRDLRNGSLVHNVTRKSARKLWLYAILQHERGQPELAEVLWHPDLPIGVWRRGERAGATRFDLVSRQGPEGAPGSLRVHYGVTTDGLTGPWADLLRIAEDAKYVGPQPIEG